MPDLEQPEPSEIDNPDEAAERFKEIVEPIEDEMPDATLTAIAYQASMVGVYYLTLRQTGVPSKRATDFTHHWMDLCGVEE